MVLHTHEFNSTATALLFALVNAAIWIGSCPLKESNGAYYTSNTEPTSLIIIVYIFIASKWDATSGVQLFYPEAPDIQCLARFYFTNKCSNANSSPVKIPENIIINMLCNGQ